MVRPWTPIRSCRRDRRSIRCLSAGGGGTAAHNGTSPGRSATTFVGSPCSSIRSWTCGRFRAREKLRARSDLQQFSLGHSKESASTRVSGCSPHLIFASANETGADLFAVGRSKVLQSSLQLVAGPSVDADAGHPRYTRGSAPRPPKVPGWTMAAAESGKPE